MDREDKGLVLRERIVDFAANGMMQKRWCAQNGVPAHQFDDWRQRENGSNADDEHGVLMRSTLLRSDKHNVKVHFVVALTRVWGWYCIAERPTNRLGVM